MRKTPTVLKEILSGTIFSLFMGLGISVMSLIPMVWVQIFWEGFPLWEAVQIVFFVSSSVTCVYSYLDTWEQHG
jgi:hypothetical protein